MSASVDTIQAFFNSAEMKLSAAISHITSFESSSTISSPNSTPSMNPLKLITETRALQKQITQVQAKLERILSMRDSMEKELAAISADLEPEVDSTLDYLVKPKK